ncbi:MAG: hypothetical protein AAF611_21895 [Bacteroidota bacterium]
MIKKIVVGIGLLILFIISLLYFKVIWLLAPYYDIEKPVELQVPIMDMEAYKEIWDTHRRPYIYSISSPKSEGKVCVVGIDHTKDPTNSNLDSLVYYWNKFDPEIALVEGRVGNLITWFQDPIKELGEGGLVTKLANEKGIQLYSWESRREKEIEFLIQKYTPEEIAMFYTFRPYFSNMRYGKYDNPESTLQEYLENRTDYPSIRGVFKTWQELDKKWKDDFPNIEWRDYGSGKGYPKGYLNEIWNYTNLLRDEHMVNMIIELVNKDKKVFVTMGVSHAPRIENTLKATLE